jgi:hypothetical protein
VDRDVIERYAAGAAAPAKAIAGLSRDELNAFPVPGTWSIQQIVVHLMDSDLIGADRMKRVAAEDRPPTLIGYDESAFARGLFYDQLDPQLACEVFEKNRHSPEAATAGQAAVAPGSAGGQRQPVVMAKSPALNGPPAEPGANRVASLTDCGNGAIRTTCGRHLRWRARSGS